MNKSLFQIGQEYLQLAEELTDNGGEITPEIEQRLSINEKEIQTKGVNYALVIRQLSHEANNIDAEIERLQKLKKSKENAVNRLKETLKNAMILFGIQSIKGDLVNILLRNNRASLHIDESKLPKKYWKKKIDEQPNKVAIKEALESGISVKGAELRQSKSVTIK